MPDLTFADAAQWFEQSAQDFERDFRDAEQRTVDDALVIAEGLSSGPHSTADLRRMGHPYARRHGKPLLNPAIINAQTGTFRASWDGESPRPDGDGLTAAIFNTDPKAELLQSGTRTMFARPIDAQIEEDLAPRREARLERALDKLTS